MRRFSEKKRELLKMLAFASIGAFFIKLPGLSKIYSLTKSSAKINLKSHPFSVKRDEEK